MADVGVVVIGRNEGQRLLQCLATARKQCSQVVYVDSASTDGSVDAARTLDVTIVSLSADAPFTAARGRRAGLQRLLEISPSCRFVQFVDGDCVLYPAWLGEAHAFLEGRPEAAVACGRRREAFPDASFYNRLIDAEWDTPIGLAKACGGDALMRVEAVHAAGSFRADLLAGEEPELCSRLRALDWEIWRIDAPMTEHDAKITRLSQWLRRARRGGFGYAQVWKATRDTGYQLYGRQIASALFWTLLVPIAALIGAVALRDWRALLLVPIAYAFQISRIALRGPHQSGLVIRLRAAAVIMMSKLAETAGILSYWFGAGQHRVTSYRSAASPPPLADKAG